MSEQSSYRRPEQEFLLDPSPQLYLMWEPSDLQPALTFLSGITGSDPESIAAVLSDTLKELTLPQEAFNPASDMGNNMHFARVADRILTPGGQVEQLSRKLMHWYGVSVELVASAHEAEIPPPLADWRQQLDDEVRAATQGRIGIPEGPIEQAHYDEAIEKAGGEQDVHKSVMCLFDEMAMQARAFHALEALIKARLIALRDPACLPVTLSFLEKAWNNIAEVFYGDASQEEKQNLLINLSQAVFEKIKEDDASRAALMSFCQEWTYRRNQAYLRLGDVITRSIDKGTSVKQPVQETVAPQESDTTDEAAASRLAEVQSVIDKHFELTHDWVMPSVRQARKAGYLNAFNALRGRAPGDGQRLNPPVEDGQALVIVGALHRLQQALDSRYPLKWLSNILQQEQSLQTSYEAIIPDSERQTDMLYATRMVDYLYDNWEKVAPLFGDSVPQEKLEEVRRLLASALHPESVRLLSPTERILRALGGTGLDRRVQLLDLKPLATNDGRGAPDAQKRQDVSAQKREVASQLNIDPDQIREERLKCFLGICQDLQPDVEVFIVNHTDIGKDQTRLPFRNYLVAVFEYEEGRKAFYAENIAAGDRASYFYVETPEWPWRTALALRKEDVQRLGGVMIVHPPGNDPDGDRKHAERLRKVLFGN